MTAPLIIVGGGLAGSLAAVALARAHPGRPLLLLEAGDRFGGNHTWSWFDGDLPGRPAIDPAELDPVRWPRHRVAFPGRRREIGQAYNAVASSALDRLVREALPPQAWRLGCAVRTLDAGGVMLAGGERIAGCGVIDARGPHGTMPGLELGWQKFVGLEFAAEDAASDCATIMDATVAQHDGYRFVYVLPYAADRVLVEDTYYSDSSRLDEAAVTERVMQYAGANALAGAVVRRERGVVPVVLGGAPARFWPADDPVARIGVAGGFCHPTTGYSLPMALGIAGELARLQDWSAPALSRWTRARFLAHWRATGFERLLGRMLFRAARPTERWQVFRHFYRMPEATIARFYAGKLTMGDRLRILSGRPPVPVGSALAAMLGKR